VSEWIDWAAIELAVAFVMTIMGFVCCLVVLRNNYRRQVRNNFRRIIREQHLDENVEVQERELASIIVGAIKDNNPASLKDVKPNPFITSYILDPDFQLKFSAFLIECIAKYKLKPSDSDLNKIFEVMAAWQNLDKNLEHEVLRDAADQADVEKYLRQKPGFFSSKVDNFVEDVKRAVEDVKRSVAAA
jgi:hypothetical protein